MPLNPLYRTNNWSDYGGMDVYVNQIVGSGSAHDLFYTNANVISAYKNYIKTFVGRYSSNPVIFGWELGEYPRFTLWYSCSILFSEWTQVFRKYRVGTIGLEMISLLTTIQNYLRKLHHFDYHDLGQHNLGLHQVYRLKPFGCYWRWRWVFLSDDKWRLLSGLLDKVSSMSQATPAIHTKALKELTLTQISPSVQLISGRSM